MAVAKVERSEGYRAYCELQHMGCTVAKMIYLLRKSEGDDALVYEAIDIFKKIDELKGMIDSMFLDGYFKELDEKLEKGGL